MKKLSKDLHEKGVVANSKQSENRTPEYEKSIQWIDKEIRPILEEDLPEVRDNHIQFDNLRDRQDKLYEVYQRLYADELISAERRVEFLKKQYEQAVAVLNTIRLSR